MLTKAEELLELSFSVASRCSVDILKTIKKFIGKHLLPSLFLIKFHGVHCMKRVQIRSFFWSVCLVFGLNTGKYRLKETPRLGTFHTVVDNFIIKSLRHKCFPVNFSIVLKTPALKNICKQLFLVFY